MLRPGFEPESSARKAGMIDRTTLPEHPVSYKGTIAATRAKVPLRVDGQQVSAGGFLLSGYMYALL